MEFDEGACSLIPSKPSLGGADATQLPLMVSLAPKWRATIIAIIKVVGAAIYADAESEMNWLSAASDIATVVLAIVGIGAYGWYQIDLFNRRRRLEDFLKGEVKGKRHKDDQGRRTVLFLASQLRMTEAEVLEAGFKSKKIKCVPGFDKETHRTDAILFEYDRDKSN